MTNAVEVDGISYALVEQGPFVLSATANGLPTGFELHFSRRPSDREQRDFLEQVHRNLSVSPGG